MVPLQDLWAVITHWPWSTIAAIAAAAAAIWVPRFETRERANVLGRETVVEINASALRWHNEVLAFLTMVRGHITNKVSAEELNEGCASHVYRCNRGHEPHPHVCTHGV
jgi:hypothetical protein